MLTTLDAILTEERGILRIVTDELKKGKYSNLISKLKGLVTINSKKDSISPLIVLAASRVTSILLGELPYEMFSNEQTVFLLDLLQIKR